MLLPSTNCRKTPWCYGVECKQHQSSRLSACMGKPLLHRLGPCPVLHTTDCVRGVSTPFRPRSPSSLRSTITAPSMYGPCPKPNNTVGRTFSTESGTANKRTQKLDRILSCTADLWLRNSHNERYRTCTTKQINAWCLMSMMPKHDKTKIKHYLLTVLVCRWSPRETWCEQISGIFIQQAPLSASKQLVYIV